MVTRSRLAWPVAVVAIGALMMAGVGCDDDFEEMFEDFDLSFVSPFGGYGGYGGSYCGGCPSYGCGDCGGGYYYYEEEEWWDSWWW